MGLILLPADIEVAADLLKTLANPQRLTLVCALLGGERSVGDLERDLAIRQPSLSQHLGTLREGGVIAVARKEAKVVFYKISDARAGAVVDAVAAIFGPASKTKIRHPLARPATVQSKLGDAAMFARIGV